MTPKQLYIQQLLNHHPSSSDVSWSHSRASKRLAAQLYDRGIPLTIVQSAILLVAARRTFRDTDAVPLPPIRTLYYFLPEIEEFTAHPPDPEYIQYLSYKLHHLA
jgi:hypothetical protein